MKIMLNIMKNVSHTLQGQKTLDLVSISLALRATRPHVTFWYQFRVIVIKINLRDGVGCLLNMDMLNPVYETLSSASNVNTSVFPGVSRSIGSSLPVYTTFL